MSDSEPNLDPDALRYQEHWQPVLDAPARRLFARVAAVARAFLPFSGEQPAGDDMPRLLDLGAGTGALASLAAERWPHAAIIGLDVSGAMLAVAERRVAAIDRGHGRPGAEWLVRDARATGLEAGSIDAVVSSFALQLVGDRAAVLREVHRVLCTGGVFGFVTWIAEDLQMPPDTEFDEAVYELELDDPDSVFRESKPGDYESIEQARDELVAAGFSDIDVRPDTLAFSWSPDAYLRFKESYDERELFDSLSGPDRARLLENVQRRWEALPATAFSLQAPLVTATARRSQV